MDVVSSVVEKVKGFAKSSQEFVDGVIHRRQNASRHNPIEILKRLQREAFSDLMKLRDRQDNVERVLSFYKTSKAKGSPFQEASTHIRGEVDVLGAILMMGDIDQQNCDALSRAGIRTGIDSKFTFETAIRQKDTLVAEFVASQKGKGNLGDTSGSPLSLTKVFYMANVCDWLSAIAIPVGTQFRDIDIATNSFHQGRGLTDFTFSGPPLLNQHNGSAIGLMVKKSNVVCSLAQSVSGLGMEPGSVGAGNCFSSTFGQVVCQLPGGIKLSLLGVQQMPKSSRHSVNLGALTFPASFLKHPRAPTTTVEASAPPAIINTQEIASIGSIALKLESDLDESTRIGGWIEMKNSNPKHLQWAVTMSDNSEDDLRWGMSFGGMIEGPKGGDQFQVESYVKLNLGNRVSLKPGLAYVMDRNARTLALMLGSNWIF